MSADPKELLDNIFESLLQKKLLPEGAHNRREETLNILEEALKEMNGGEINEQFLTSPKAERSIIKKTWELASMPKKDFDALMDLYDGKSVDSINKDDLKNGIKRLFKGIVKDNQLDEYADQLVQEFKNLEQANPDAGSKNGMKKMMSNALVMEFCCMAIPAEIGASQEQTYINKGLNPTLVLSHATSPDDLTQGDPSGQVAQALRSVLAQGSEPGYRIDEMVLEGIISKQYFSPELRR